MVDNRIFYKRIVLVVSVFFFMVAAIWIYKYLSTGKLIVSTDNSSTFIKITRLYETGKEKSFSKQAQGNLDIRVSPGKYEVAVFSKSLSASKIVRVQARQTKYINLNPPKVGSPEPVYGNGVSGLFASGSSAYFVDKSSQNLTRVLSDGKVFPISQTTFQSAKWVSLNIGAAVDTNNNLYKIRGNSIQKLSLPFDAKNGSGFSYDLSPLGDIYLAYGKSLFKQEGFTFKKIYDAKQPIGDVSVSGSRIAIAEPFDIDSGFKGLVVVLGDNSVVEKSIVSDNIAWSPDGSKLLVANKYGVNSIYNTSLKLLSSMSSQGSHFVWANNSSLIYSVSGALWGYSIPSNTSQELSQMPGQGNIDGLYANSDGSYVYVSAQRVSISGDTADQLFRVGLRGDGTNSNLLGLSVFMPESLDYCALNYVNFTKPTVLINYPQGSSAQDCLDAAKGEVQSYNIDPSSLAYQLTPYSVD